MRRRPAPMAKRIAISCLAPGGAGQQQVRHLAQAMRSTKPTAPSRTSRVNGHRRRHRLERIDTDAVLGVRFRIGLGQAGRDGIHFRLRLRSVTPALSRPTRTCRDASRATGQDVVPLIDQRVDVGIAFELKTAGRCPRRIATAVEGDLTAEHAGSGTRNAGSTSRHRLRTTGEARAGLHGSRSRRPSTD